MLVSAPTVIDLPPGVHSAIDIPDGVKGLIVRGSGRVGDNATIVQGLRAKGLWYSRFENLCFAPPVATDVVVDIDGTAFGIQGNTFTDCLFSGRGLYDGETSQTAFYMNRTAGNSGQGSENAFFNCHFSGARNCYIQNGYNALNNTFVGGNFQDYLNGITAYAGSFNVFSTGFQSTHFNEQLDAGPDDGWDIRADSGGVSDQILIQGCRTESVKFYKGGGSQPVTLQSCTQYANINSLDKSKYQMRDGVLYKFTGGAWSPFVHNVVDILGGTVSNCTFTFGKIAQYHNMRDTVLEVDESCDIPIGVSCVFASAEKKSIVLKLPNPADIPQGTKIEVVRADNHPTNTLTIKSDYLGNRPVHSMQLKRGGLTFRALGGHVAPRRFYPLDQPSSSRFVD